MASGYLSVQHSSRVETGDRMETLKFPVNVRDQYWWQVRLGKGELSTVHSPFKTQILGEYSQDA